MVFPELSTFADVALLVLRVMIALVFLSSGWSHATKPKERAEGLGMPPAVTFVLGALEVLGGICLILGIYVQIVAIVFICIMLGAIWKKMFTWHTGFFGGESNGWYYDLLYLTCNLVLLTLGAGSIAIT